MKFLILLAICALVAARPDDKFKNLNVEELLQNNKLVESFLKCFDDKGPCTPDAKSLKELIPEGIKTSCGECSDKEKSDIKKFLFKAKAEYPEEYKALINKHDPEGKRSAELEEFLAN